MTTALAMCAAAFAQQPAVKVNVLNVCQPSADEQKELSAALAKVPGKPVFSTDYEVARGHSTLDQSTPIPGMQALPPGAVSAPSFGAGTTDVVPSPCDVCCNNAANSAATPFGAFAPSAAC